MSILRTPMGALIALLIVALAMTADPRERADGTVATTVAVDSE